HTQRARGQRSGRGPTPVEALAGMDGKSAVRRQTARREARGRAAANGAVAHTWRTSHESAQTLVACPPAVAGHPGERTLREPQRGAEESAGEVGTASR